MLRMTSKKVKDVMDRVHLPAVVRVRRSFLNDPARGTVTQRLKQIFAQLVLLVDRCRITGIELSGCQMKGKYVESLAGVLAQCPALARLGLSSNEIGPDGAERLAGVLEHSTALAHLEHSDTGLRGFSIDSAISSGRVGRLAEVLPRCPSLSHLHLSNNGIGLDDGPGRK